MFLNESGVGAHRLVDTVCKEEPCACLISSAVTSVLDIFVGLRALREFRQAS